jgi:hypothetical protein
MVSIRLAIISALATLLACAAAREATADPLWGQVVVPGGVSAVRRVMGLGEGQGRLDAGLVVDFTYRHARSGDWSRAQDRLRRYLATVETITQSVGRAAGPIAPPPEGASTATADAFRELHEALGIERRRVDGRWRYVGGSSSEERERAAWASALGLDVEAMAVAWTAGEAETIAIPSGAVPVPLPALWPSSPADALTLDALVRTRSTGLFYTALMGLDDATLAWFAEHPDVLRRVRDRSAPVFAAFARSLRIDHGAVVTPGPAALAASWARLTGHATADAGAFIEAALTRDDGLLMSFLDAVGHAAPSVQQAIASCVALRPAAIDEMYRAFRDGAGTWSVVARPFDRPAQDPAWTLSLLELPEGRVGGPAWLPLVLDRVVTEPSWPGKPAALPARLPAGDAEWTIRWLLERPADQVERVRLLRFAQRLEKLDAATPNDVEAALRTYRWLPALALALERMGLHDPATIGRTGRAAYLLSRAGDRRTVEPLLVQWQSSLALLEQVTRLRRVPVNVTGPLVLALADAAIRPPDEVIDRILHWTTDALLPALAPQVAGTAFDRESIARLASGEASDRSVVVWEGLRYDRNPLRVARRDLDALVLPVAPFTDKDALERLHARLDQGLRSRDEARATAEAFDALLATTGRPAIAGAPIDDDVSRKLAAASRKLRSDPPLTRSGAPSEWHQDIAAPFGAAAGWAIQPIVYALAMTPLHGAPALLRDAWTFHALAGPDARDDWWRTAWKPARQEPRVGGGSGLVGSWLLIDLSLGEPLVPRRFDRTESVAIPVLEAIFRAVAFESRSLPAQVDVWTDGARRLARGRAVVQSWQMQAAAGNALVRSDPRASAIGATRRSILTWTLEHDQAADLSLSEIAAIGGPPDVSTLELDGAASLGVAPAWTLEDARPYWMRGAPATFVADVPLRIAELLSDAHLPLSLVADILPLAAADWLSHVDAYANDDWEALVQWPKRMTPADIEGYVMQLIAEGILEPVDEAVP